MTRSTLIAALSLALLMSGYAMGADGEMLVANWKAVELNGKAVDGPTLDYAMDKVSGTGGCNRFFGPIELSDEDKVKIGPLATSRMMCEGKMNIERDYLAALGAARTFELQDGTLVLKGDGGTALVKFRK